jgi:hypothetical protein
VAREPGRERWRLELEELRELWQSGLARAWSLADEPVGAVP